MPETLTMPRKTADYTWNDCMTDVSDRARRIGIEQPVFISPSVLFDIERPPRHLEVRGETDTARLERLFAKLEDILLAKPKQTRIEFSVQIPTEVAGTVQYPCPITGVINERGIFLKKAGERIGNYRPDQREEIAAAARVLTPIEHWIRPLIVY